MCFRTCLLPSTLFVICRFLARDQPAKIMRLQTLGFRFPFGLSVASVDSCFALNSSAWQHIPPDRSDQLPRKSCGRLSVYAVHSTYVESQNEVTNLNCDSVQMQFVALMAYLIALTFNRKQVLSCIILYSN